MAPKLFLHSHPASSYAQKVRIALREKGIPFDFATPEGLGTGKSNPSLAAGNPRLEVPVLQDGEFTIFESSIILSYLEEKYPERALLPEDAKSRAIAKMIEQVCDTHYEGINWGYSEVVWMGRAEGELADKLKANAKLQIEEIYAWLSVRLGDNDFFNGETFGYADIVVAPYVNRSLLYGFSPGQGTALQKWHARISQIPSVKETFEEMEKAVPLMAGLKDAFKPGMGNRREYRDHRLEWMIKSGGIEVVQQGLRDQTIRFSWPGGM